jgi:hypothetical protein
MGEGRRSRSRSAWRLVVACAALAAAAPVVARGRSVSGVASLARFPGQPDAELNSYVAIRHLSASARNGSMRASAVVWTSLDPRTGFSYVIQEEEGAGSIRHRVFRAVLEGERKSSRRMSGSEALITPENYEFEPEGAVDGGLIRVRATPRRKDPMLVDGALFVRPEDGDLVRLEGHLSKRPSFWTRRVDVVHRFARLAGVRVPISVESNAQVLFVGRGTFTMTWDYDSINGVPLHNAAPRLAEHAEESAQ